MILPRYIKKKLYICVILVTLTINKTHYEENIPNFMFGYEPCGWMGTG